MTATEAPVFDAGLCPDQDPYVRQADCPSWCSIHPMDGIAGLTLAGETLLAEDKPVGPR